MLKFELRNLCYNCIAVGMITKKGIGVGSIRETLEVAQSFLLIQVFFSWCDEHQDHDKGLESCDMCKRRRELRKRLLRELFKMDDLIQTSKRGGIKRIKKLPNNTQSESGLPDGNHLEEFHGLENTFINVLGRDY